MHAQDRHPSFFELDCLAIGHFDDDLSEHVESCAECQQYLEQHQVSQTDSAPLWLRNAARERQETRPPWRRRIVWSLSFAGAAAVAGVLAVILPSGEVATSRGTYVGAKGIPSIALYVKHGDDVALWDGHSSVQQGDQIRLKVHPEGFRILSVFTRGSGKQKPLLLFSDSVEGKTVFILPHSWEIDAVGHTDELLVVLSESPIDEGQTWMELNVASSHRWTTLLTIPKHGSE